MIRGRKHRRGVTLVELTMTVTIVGTLTAIAVPRAVTVMERLHVRGAKQDVVFALATARAAAVRHGAYASIVVEASTGRVRVVSGGKILWARDVAGGRGVTVTVTRDSITYAPTGVGWGAANTTIVVRRGECADTITTSRLGRVRS